MIRVGDRVKKKIFSGRCHTPHPEGVWGVVIAVNEKRRNYTVEFDFGSDGKIRETYCMYGEEN